MTLVKDQPKKGQSCFKLAGDFGGGGRYVQTIRGLAEIEMKDLAAIRLKVKTDNVKSMNLRLIDSTEQCHQAGGLPIVADGQWHDMVIKPENVVGGEHWGGANDGKWHGPARLVAMIIGPGPDGQVKQPVIYLGDIRAEVLEAAVLQPASFQNDFESARQLPAGWTSEGRVSIDRQTAFKGRQSLVLEQPAEDAEKPCSMTTATFAAAPGLWQIGLACKSELKSPDSSFDGVVTLECIDRAGRTVDSIVLADLFGRKSWQPISKRIELAKGVSAARFRVQLNKAVGRFWIDEISAAFVSAAPKKDKRVDRILFATAQMGNLLYPEDKRTVAISVVATKPLDEKQKEVSCILRDYWGAEQGPAVNVALGSPRREGKNYVYEGQLDLGGAGLELGRYYELHAEIPREGDEPFHNFTSLAILPKAAAKQFKPEEIPFTSRSWDNRISECFYLSDRLGIRVCGIWGGWSADPPYEPYAPTIELCEKLGMGVLTGSPAAAIEHHDGGWEKYDEKALRQGVRNWIARYGKIRPLMIDLGNEPPLNPERVRANVAAYKAIYEEVKKIDPGITVIASSMGPVEEYFQAGFQNFCDVVDFHAYEDWSAIPGTFKLYDKYFAKYGGRKPIWATEIGLNSQGMLRQVVATTLVKKLTLFFACGGQNISWFDMMYPDGDAKLAGTSSEAHNVFDARYCRYCPKLDAVAYYNMVNGISIKKFVGQKTYNNGTSAFLFRDRDNRSLQVLWKDKGRADIWLPMPGVDKVTIIDIDGRRSELNAAGKGLALTVTEDPVLLLYEGGAGELPDKLGASPVRITSLPEGLIKGVASRLSVSFANDRTVELIGPPTWTIRNEGSDGSGQSSVSTCFITVPQTSNAREGSLVVKLKDGSGELHARVPVTGRVAVRLLPVAPVGGKSPAVRLLVKNYSAEKQDVTWRLALTGEISVINGEFGSFGPTAAYFGDAAEGTTTIDGKATADILVPLAGVDPLTIYRVKAGVSDASGRTVTSERPVAGFAAVPRATGPIKLDGSMNEADWTRSPVQHINQARQYFAYDRQKTQWKGPSDLSATVQLLWDDKYLYLGVKVTDDVFANNKTGADLWAGDGLQFIVDPAREAAEKPGKYDIAAALTKDGPAAYCFLSASSLAPEGLAKDIRVSCKRASADRGDMNYVVAIPWSRVAPFKPAVGANLGMCVVLNEDDGPGRASFMGWFGDVQSKRVDTVGDLILGR